MATNPLSSELCQFMARHIRSIEQLEILCLFAENRDKFWSPEEIFKQIQSSHDSVAAHFHYFAEEGFLMVNAEGNFRFSPSSPEVEQQTFDLIKVYRERRVAVIEALYTMPSDPIRQFADAFRLGKKKR